MRFSSLSTILFTGAALSVGASATAAGQLSSRSALAELAAIFGRQTTFCSSIPPPYTCERSCGAGYVACIAFPTCYNPGLGEVCCSNGDYCNAGTYCTDAGCCPDGTSLADCGASVSLSIVPPPATSSAPPSTSTSASSAATTSSTTSKSVASTTSSTPSSTSTKSAATTATSTTTKSNVTFTSASSSSPAQFTAGSSAGLSRDSSLVNLVLGGLGLFLLL